MKRCFGSFAAILVFSTAIAQSLSEFSYVDKFYEGRAIVVRGGKCGFIDEQEKVVVPLINAFAKPFSEGLAPVVKGQWISQTRIDGFYGYVDLYGEEVTPFEYEDAKSFSEGIATVLIDGKWGGIDREGNLVIKPQFDDSFCFCSDRAVVGVKSGDGTLRLYRQGGKSGAAMPVRRGPRFQRRSQLDRKGRGDVSDRQGRNSGFRNEVT